jgi:hypothetical protein
MARWHLPFALSLLPAALAQLPPSIPLGDTDRPQFQAEIARLESLLKTAPDQAAVTYQMARTYAAGKQWAEALDWVRKAVAFRAGLDPLRDAIFAPLRGTREFAAIESAVLDATPPVLHSRPAFTVSEGDLEPESMAHDPQGKKFYFGSMRKGKVIRCSPAGACEVFADGLGVVLGLKVHGRGLWLLDNSERQSALLHYDLATARLARRYAVNGPGHTFNDLTISPSGDVYLTDTRAAAVWTLQNGGAELSKLAGQFRSANGIALSPDAGLLYVSAFPDGITIVDLKTSASSAIVRPAGICLAAIDGLYFQSGALIAIQNGFMNPRVVRLKLSASLRAIQDLEVLERRNPLFDGITTGTLDGSDFFYMANIQDDKNAGFVPITILNLRP